MKIGFIGCGNMGKAMLKGMLEAKLVNHNEVMVSTHTQLSAQAIQKQFDVNATCDNLLVAKKCEYIILAIKPYMFEDVITNIKESANDKVIISVAAGVTLAQIQSYFQNEKQKIVRAMPNTPACVGMAMSSLSFNDFIGEEEKQFVIALFQSFGQCVQVEESLIHAVIGVSGSSPAYVFMFLDAMINNGIKHGLTKEVATILATQTMQGAAKMVATLDSDPTVLTQNVCSPNGTTIEAVKVLEHKNIKAIVEEAMDACIARSKEMSQ